MRRLALVVILFVSSTLCFAKESPLKENCPENYTVLKGDTLWDISNMFLKSPWLWPEIWHANPAIHNPHLIFPGDVVSVVDIDGQPRLTVINRGISGRTVKLSPKVRRLPNATAIPPIPLGSIKPYLKFNKLFDSNVELERAPYIFAFEKGHSVASQGDKVYARGSFDPEHRVYDVFIEGITLNDPITKEPIGVVSDKIASLSVISVKDDVATLRVKEAKREIKGEDRLFVQDPYNTKTTFFPRAPDAPIDGLIIGSIDGTSKSWKMDTVVINRGEREGLKQGDILAIYKEVQVEDTYAEETITLDPEKVGLLMVYRPYQRLSYAVVLSASQSIEAGDLLKSP